MFSLSKKIITLFNKREETPAGGELLSRTIGLVLQQHTDAILSEPTARQTDGALILQLGAEQTSAGWPGRRAASGDSVRCLMQCNISDDLTDDRTQHST